MKKVFWIITFAIVLVAVVVVGGGYLIGPEISLGAERDLAAPATSVRQHLASAKGIEAWWNTAQESAKEGTPKLTVRKESGPEEGVGLIVVFESDGEMFERWTVTHVAPDRVEYDVDFQGLLTVHRTLTVTDEGDHTHVTWHETGLIEHPVARWMKVVMPADKTELNFQVALQALERASQPKAP